MRTSRAALALSGIQCLLALASAVLLADEGRWSASIFLLLLVFTLVSDRLEVEAKLLRISGAFLGIGLAMVLMGPLPAATIGVITAVADSVQRRPPLNYVVSNLATFLVFPLLGGWMVHVVADYWNLKQGDIDFALVVIGAFVIVNAVNFLQVALTRRMVVGASIRAATIDLFVPLLPSQLVIGILGALIVYGHAHGGGVLLGLCVGVVVLYQYLLRELLLSRERAEQLGKRTTQLASLQVGVLTVLLQTLSLRDKMTARHCAAVARYSREIAREAGCDEEQQDLVHTAALLHDIGKFIFPDHILSANTQLDEADWVIVRKHPAQGAKVVRQVEGYGPVADIILAHHERIDGTGYPRGLAGEEIPMLARMISVADTYDVLTARDSYREPIPPTEAFQELRRVSGTQLDTRFVELFVRLLERKGVGFHHGDDADFDREIDLERRVREYAAGRPD